MAGEFGTGAKSRLAIVDESAWGTTPNTPTMKIVRMTGATLELSRATLENTELVGDRQRRAVKLGTRQVTGDINGVLSYKNFDDLIAYALQGSWGNDAAGTPQVVKAGSTLKSFTAELAELTIAQYRVFTGCMVNQMQITGRPNQMATCRFGILGKDMTQSGTPLQAAGSMTAAPTNDPAVSWDATVNEGGGAIAYLTGFDFTLDNGITLPEVIGSSAAPQPLNSDLCKISGSLSAYYKDAALIAKFLAGTESSFDITLKSDATHTLIFKLGSFVYTRAGVPINGPGGLIVTLPFEAYYNSGDTTSIVVTRSNPVGG